MCVLKGEILQKCTCKGFSFRFINTETSVSSMQFLIIVLFPKMLCMFVSCMVRVSSFPSTALHCAGKFNCTGGIRWSMQYNAGLSKILFCLPVLTFIVSGHLWKSWTKTREFSRRLSGSRQNRARTNSFQKYDDFLFPLDD